MGSMTPLPEAKEMLGKHTEEQMGGGGSLQLW